MRGMPTRQGLNRRDGKCGNIMKEFQDYANYYDAFYKDKDYEKEAKDAEQIIKNLGDGKVLSVLDMGCGTGRHDEVFARGGCQVTGIDISSRMIAEAKKNNGQKGFSIEYEVADVRNYRSEKHYDGVVSLFHVMSYQNTNEDIIRAFQTASKALRKGGIFVIDFWYGPGVLSDKPSVRVREAEDAGCRLCRIAEPVMHVEENVVDVNYKIFVMDKKTGITKTVEEVHKMRYFFIPELKFYLHNAGLDFLECLDCNTLQKTDFDSWTAVCAARKV